MEVFLKIEIIIIIWKIVIKIQILPSRSEIFKSFPILKFKIENTIFEWLPKNYLIFKDKEFCLGFEKENNPNINTITLGATFMRNHDFLIDFEKNSLGYVKSNCSPSVK